MLDFRLDANSPRQLNFYYRLLTFDANCRHAATITARARSRRARRHPRTENTPLDSAQNEIILQYLTRSLSLSDDDDDDDDDEIVVKYPLRSCLARSLPVNVVVVAVSFSWPAQVRCRQAPFRDELKSCKTLAVSPL